MIKINTDVIEDAIGRILEAIGEDRNRQGLVDTPKRVAKMYSEIFSGIGVDLDKQLQVTFDESYEDMVIVKDIPMQSICEHHLLPFFGHAHIVYIPKNNVITGLSKLVRLVDVACKKPQLQERLTKDIGETINKTLSPVGVYVLIEAEHLCIAYASTVLITERNTATTHRALRKACCMRQL